MAKSLTATEDLPGLSDQLSDSGWFPYVATALSLVVCYFKAIAVAVLPALGSSWTLNPHIQAFLMWLFGALAVFSIYRDISKHGDRRPFYIALAGLLVIVATLYTWFHYLILFVGYLLLLIGTFANQNAIFRLLQEKTQQQAHELADWNQTLEKRVEKQVRELSRIGQLKRFMAPEVAELVVTQAGNELLQSHRCFVAALFCDLRHFTRFSEQAEPEEVIDVLQAYHRLLGQLVKDSGGTINHRAGDGMLVIFNDPFPCEDPVFAAIELAIAIREGVGALVQEWSRLGYHLGIGCAVAAGYATLGMVGDEQRSDYTAIGNVINLASRLCDEAEDGEILISHRASLEAEDKVAASKVDAVKLKGISQAQEVYKLDRLL